MSTSRWHQSQGRHILVDISHIVLFLFKNLTCTCSLNVEESCATYDFFSANSKMCESFSSYAESVICTKLCTQNLWTLIIKKYQIFDNPKNVQLMKKTTSKRLQPRQEVPHILPIIMTINTELGSAAFNGFNRPLCGASVVKS